ncbi:response regulator [Stenotrophomonas geniculata]|uniref:response regulator n=1 Tax=Stenotrophomonas geniculata TaxID=86188 RepID=UPI003AAE89DE
MRNLLLVEDSDYKRTRISEFLSLNFSGLSVDVAVSFNSGARLLDSKDYDVVLMDMSLPTFDITSTESGGRFRALGGRELARRISRRGRSSRIVFVTQFNSFSDDVHSHSLKSLSDTLREDCGDLFAGVVYYDGAVAAWKDELLDILSAL